MMECAASQNPIGIIEKASQHHCQFRLTTLDPPEVGTWVKVKDTSGLIESYHYESNSVCKGDIRIVNNEQPWAPPITPGALVSVASDAGVRCGGIPIPAGFVMGESPLRFDLNSDYVIGPEGAHINASGISGLATKTSYLMSVLHGLMKTSSQHQIPVTAFVINLKHQDLMAIDRPAQLKQSERDLYQTLQIDDAPFSRTKYFVPSGSPSHVQPDATSFGYSLKNGFGLLGNLVADLPDRNKTIAALAEALIHGYEHTPEEFGPYHNWKSIWTEAPLVPDGYQPSSWSHFAQATTRRFVRHLQMVLDHANTGLFVNKSEGALPTLADVVDQAGNGTTQVLDFSNLSDVEQFFCMMELVRCIHEDVKSSQRRLPRHVVLFVDELNRFGGRGSQAHPIRDLLVDVSERGRSIGLSLITAQQFASYVHPRIFGNAATRVVGRLPSDELSRSEYRFLNPRQKEWLRFMPKGQVIVSHSPIGQAVKVMFPRPAFRIGEAS